MSRRIKRDIRSIAEGLGLRSDGLRPEGIALFVVDEAGGGSLRPSGPIPSRRNGEGRSESLADIAVSVGGLHANGVWRSSISAVARALGPDGILFVREVFNPDWAPWIGPLLWGSARDFTWRAFVDHCRSSGLEMVAYRRFWMLGEAIFIKP